MHVRPKHSMPYFQTTTQQNTDEKRYAQVASKLKIARRTF